MCLATTNDETPRTPCRHCDVWWPTSEVENGYCPECADEVRHRDLVWEEGCTDDSHPYGYEVEFTHPDFSE